VIDANHGLIFAHATLVAIVLERGDRRKNWESEHCVFVMRHEVGDAGANHSGRQCELARRCVVVVFNCPGQSRKYKSLHLFFRLSATVGARVSSIGR
jgi:hypothetical protein